jgi:hypothetical protein
MDKPTLPGRTEWESREYLKDHGHRIAVVMAYRYIAKRIETDPDFPLPLDAEAVIARAAAAMQSLAALREGIAGTITAMQVGSAA